MEPLNLPSLAACDKNSDTYNKKGNSLKYTQSRVTNSSASSSGSFFVVCVLCAVCVVVSVYSGWREASIENRLNILENRVAFLETRSLDNVNVLIERVRKDVDEQFHKRVLRQAAAVVRGSVLLGTHKRTTRDIPECICPAGIVLDIAKYKCAFKSAEISVSTLIVKLYIGLNELVHKIIPLGFDKILLLLLAQFQAKEITVTIALEYEWGMNYTSEELKIIRPLDRANS
ncbi:hypothetical protein FQA39_LY00629 [Lamprigera yunnana]|nr:hypothetical protein FQA39_LY00629 [Lamprigera yunnana]